MKHWQRAHRHTAHIELRLALPDDTDSIADLFGEWFPMSVWKDCITYDRARAPTVIRRGIEHNYQPFILAHENGALVGLISWHLDTRYTDPIGVLDEVFVVPRLVRSDLGARLVFHSIDQAKKCGAKVYNFPLASGMRAQRSLTNMLMKRFHAEPIGVILRKVL
jgi:N-acetylglutamate synthase-like GNAT family acetyltransferase